MELDIMKSTFLNTDKTLSLSVTSMLDNLLGDHPLGNYRVTLNNSDYDENGGVCPCLVFVEKTEDKYVISEFSIATMITNQAEEFELIDSDSFNFVTGEGFVSFHYPFSVYEADGMEASEFNIQSFASNFSLGLFDITVVTAIDDSDSSENAA